VDLGNLLGNISMAEDRLLKQGPLGLTLILYKNSQDFISRD